MILPKTIILYPNKLKNWEFSKPNSQILSNLKDAREAEPCLKDRADGAGIKSANLGEEKTNSSICLGIEAFSSHYDVTICRLSQQQFFVKHPDLKKILHPPHDQGNPLKGDLSALLLTK